ncbi:MAG: PepSY domain-containing protein [Dehalococcoidia bacterium]|nr:PepSY domain-containing protein [Dehalococcoidia bacterium]
MSLSERLYLAIGLVAVIALAFSAVTLTSSLTSAGSDSAQTCDAQDAADDATEAKDAPEADSVEEQCGDQNEAEDTNEGEDDGDQAPSGTLDDGKDLLSQASITLDQAIAAAQGAASGPLGEVDLEDYQGKLVFNVDIGDKDIKVDASDGSIVSVDSDD